MASLTEKAARDANLPFEVYVLKTYDELMNAGVSSPIDLGDTFMKHDVDVIRQPSPTKQKKEAAKKEEEVPKKEENKPHGAFDHLGLLEEGRGGTRAHNKLVENFMDVDELLATPKSDILEIDGFGEGSLKLVIQKLIEQGHIADEDDWGQDDGVLVSAEADEEDEEDPEEEDDGDYHAQINALDSTDENAFTQACRIYMHSWDKEYAVAKKEITEIVADVYKKEDPDTWRYALLALKNAMPPTDDQKSTILELGTELGEDSSTTRDRAIASLGKDFDEITYGDANTLVEELEADLEQGTIKVDEEFTF